MGMRLRVARVVATVSAVVVWVLPAVVYAAAGEGEGNLVHVADTRRLTGFSLFVANLYNTDRLLFTLFSLALTAVLGLTLGLLMDGVVASIGLNLEQRQTRE
jgi:hypothetical protein